MAEAPPDELGQAIAVVLMACERAHKRVRTWPSAKKEREQLARARGAMANVAVAYCNRTGIDRAYFDRALLDGDLETEELIRGCLDLLNSLKVDINGGDSRPEMVSIKIRDLVLQFVKFARSWCHWKDIPPADLDSRLNEADFCK